MTTEISNPVSSVTDTPVFPAPVLHDQPLPRVASHRAGPVVAFVSSYVPRECGIATFTRDLHSGLDQVRRDRGDGQHGGADPGRGLRAGRERAGWPFYHAAQAAHDPTRRAARGDAAPVLQLQARVARGEPARYVRADQLREGPRIRRQGD